MKYFAALLLELLVVVSWIAGAVLAKGFCSTAVAVIFPFWAFYLVVERLMQVMGWL